MKSRSNSTGRSPHSQSISFLVLCLCVLSTLGARASSIPQWDGLRALETEYRVVDLPGEFQGLPAVAIPRGDSKKPGAAYSFEIDAPATVFIGVQRRGQSAPPAGWEPAKNIKLEWSGRAGGSPSRDLVFKKDFPAGTVTIPRHLGQAGLDYGLPHIAFVQTKDPKQPVQIRNLVHLGSSTRPPAPDLARFRGWDGLRAADSKATVESLPVHLNGLDVVGLPRGEALLPAPGYRFEVNKPVTVFLAVHQRGEQKPLDGWTDTGEEIWSSGFNFDKVYRRDFPAGKVLIPGNTGASGVYFALPSLAFVKASAEDSTGLVISGLQADETPSLESLQNGPEKLDFRYGYYPSFHKVRFLVPSPPAGVRSWEAKVRQLGDGKVLARSEGKFPMSPAAETLALPGPLPEGAYVLSLKMEGADAPVVVERMFYRHKHEWEGLNLGKEDTLIPPFTPLEVDAQAGTVAAVLRRHTMHSNGLWSQVESQDRPLLAGPIRLEVTSRGRTEAAAGEGVRFTETKPTGVSGKAEWRAGGVEGSTRFTYDYDGFMQVDLHLPAHGAEIEKMQVVIPLKATEATLMHPVTTSLRSHYAGKVPDGEGVVWDSTKANRGGLPGSFLPYIFLGGPERGVCFAVDNDRDWVLDPDVPQVQVERDGDVINLRLNLIAKPVRMQRERTIRLGFQATPAKPMPEGWRTWWADTPVRPEHSGTQLGMLGNTTYWGSMEQVSPFYPHQRQYRYWQEMSDLRDGKPLDNEFLTEWHERMPKKVSDSLRAYTRYAFDKSVGFARNPDSTQRKLMVPYICPRSAERDDSAYAMTFLDEWSTMDIAHPKWKVGPNKRATRESPMTMWYALEPVASNVDHILYYHKKMYETFADGIYWDNYFLAASYVPEEVGGPAYIDDDGRLRPGVNLMAFRELTKRNAVMMHAMGKTPLAWIHMTNVNVVPMLSFATVTFDWEWRDLGPFALRDVQSRLGIDRDPSLVLAQSLGLQAGLVPVSCSRYSPPANDQGITRDWLMRTALATCLPHEIRQHEGGRIGTFVQNTLMDFGYGRPDCRVIRYWEENYPLKAEGSRLRALVLSREGKALLAIGNFGRGDEKNVSQEEFLTKDAESIDAYDSIREKQQAGGGGSAEAGERPGAAPGQQRARQTVGIAEAPLNTPTYQTKITVDLKALGLPTTTQARNLEIVAQAGKAADGSTGLLANPAPGVFILPIRQHDFALIELQ